MTGAVVRVAVAALLAASLRGQDPAAALPPAIEDLAGRVPLIVAGSCTLVRSEWNEKKTLITTTATYQVDRVVKGRLAKGEVVVRQLGGTMGKITQALVGGPSFHVGERSLLFLKADAAGELRVYGLAAGKRPIYRDPRSGVDRVRLDDGAAGELHGLPDAAARRESAAPSARASVPFHGDIALEALAKLLAKPLAAGPSPAR